MKISHMIRENNKMRERLNKENEKYYEEIIVYIRISGIHEQRGEELLLEILQHLIHAQEKGRFASEVFGNHPIDYCRELVEQLPKPSLSERLSMLVLVLWSSLTWVFFSQTTIGFVSLLFGKSYEQVSKVSMSSILIHLLVSFVLIQLIFLFLKQSSFQKKVWKYNSILLASIWGVLAISIIAGLYLQNRLPVLDIQPWISLLLFAVGLAGLKFIFLRR